MVRNTTPVRFRRTTLGLLAVLLSLVTTLVAPPMRAWADELADNLMSIPVVIAWDDADDAYANRPGAVEVTLAMLDGADGSATLDDIATVQVGPESDWSYTFADVPAQDEEGNDLSYYVHSEGDGIYESSAPAASPVAFDGSTVVITETLPLYDIVVATAWDDEGYEDARPASVDVQLYDGESPLASRTLSAGDALADNGAVWQCRFDAMPLYLNRQAANYWIEQSATEGYQTSGGALEMLDGGLYGELTNTYVAPSEPDPISLEGATLTLEETAYVYDGSAFEPAVIVELDGQVVDASHYELGYENNVNAGEATVTVTGVDGYTGTATAHFTIAPMQATPTFALSATSYTYDGKAKKPTVSEVAAGEVALATSDYTVSYASGRTNVGTYKVTVKLKGNYSGSASKDFKITAKKVTPTVTLSATSFVYNGKVRKPTVTVKAGTVKLTSASYSLAFTSGCTKAGTYKVTVTLKGNYSGKATKAFKITPASLAKASVTGIKNKTYAGKALTQAPVVKLGGKTLKNKTDYTLTYQNNTNAGKATVIIKGKGNYGSSIKKTFTIARRDFSKAKVATISKQLYTGGAITPNPVVKWGNVKLKKGTDYTLAYKNNKALGTATVTITGKGNYTAKVKTVTFVIYQASMSSVSVESIGTQDYTGRDITPNPVITYGSKTLVRGTDYTVAYRNNRYGGTATMTITGKRGFKGSKTVSFNIRGPKHYGVTVYITDTGEKYHKAGCRYLKKSKHALDKGEAIWEGYEPCKVCRP